MTTPNIELPELTANQSQPHVPVNESLRRLDVATQLSVLDKDLTAPPGSPADGAAYIVAAGATGAWAGQDLRVAFYNAGWQFLTPRTGWHAWVVDEAKQYRYGEGSPTAWTEVASGGGGSGIAVSNSGSPGASLTGVTALNFTGAVVSDAGGGAATIAVAGGGGGGIAGVDVSNSGSPGGAVTAATSLLFEGAVVSDEGAGVAKVTVSSGGGGGGYAAYSPVIRCSSSSNVADLASIATGFAPGCVVIFENTTFSPVAIQGADPAGFGDGDWFVLYHRDNGSGSTSNIADESGSASATHRFACPSFSAVGLNQQSGVLVFRDGTANRWRIVGRN